MKQLVLNTDGVTRQSAADELNLDLRTAAAYLEQLTTIGLLRTERIAGGGKGRPVQVYRSNRNQLCSLGLALSQNLHIESMIVDATGQIRRHNELTLDPASGRLSVFNRLLSEVEACREVDGLQLFSVGLAVSRWLQPPLAGSDVYQNLSSFLARECGLSVCRDVNINACAYLGSLRRQRRNFAVVHPGLVVEFGMVLDGVPERHVFEREEWLSHLEVLPNGRRCYCGHNGCLENYLTAGAVAERLALGKSEDVYAQLAILLGRALVRVARKYPLEELLLIGVPELFAGAAEYFSTHYDGPTRLITDNSKLPVAEGIARWAMMQATGQ